MENEVKELELKMVSKTESLRDLRRDKKNVSMIVSSDEKSRELIHQKKRIENQIFDMKVSMFIKIFEEKELE